MAEVEHKELGGTEGQENQNMVKQGDGRDESIGESKMNNHGNEESDRQGWVKVQRQRKSGKKDKKSEKKTTTENKQMEKKQE